MRFIFRVIFILVFLLVPSSLIADDFGVLKDNLQQYFNQSVVITGSSNANMCLPSFDREDCNGSGVVIGVDNARRHTFVLTAKHVVGPEALMNCPVNIFLNADPLPHPATNIVLSDQTDLALVTIDGDYSQDVSKVSSNGPKILDLVFNVGAPRCQENSVGFGRVIKLLKNVLDTKVIELFLPVDGGSSGSPLYNESGNLVGIIVSKTMMFVPSSYAVPLDDVKAFLQKHNVKF